MSNEQTAAPKPTNISLNTTDLAEVRLILNVVVDSLKAGPKSRERSLVITKMEEAILWAGEGLRLE